MIVECVVVLSWVCVISCWFGDIGTYWIWKGEVDEMWFWRGFVYVLFLFGFLRILFGIFEGMGFFVRIGCV